MKNLELENFGVQEMNAQEMQNVDGGSLWVLVLVYNVWVLTEMSQPAY